LYNTCDEIYVLVDMLHRITRGDYRGTYEPRLNGAEYVPTHASAAARWPETRA
jgi:hypothetical protein